MMNSRGYGRYHRPRFRISKAKDRRRSTHCILCAPFPLTFYSPLLSSTYLTSKTQNSRKS